ncbi:MAG: isoprenylcysteine carboxylmethyltransferase family protein [Candidatus Bathyarchaeota archaeon]|nr:isoprenylcysteine carboxylmethyltransferase family protein [Candidatus Bathyarchaeota archaeon]
MKREKPNLDPSRRNQFGEEYPHSDQIQIALLLLFLAVWAVDSFLLRASTQPAEFVPLALRLPMGGALIYLGLLFVKRSHDLVIDEEYDEPTLVDTGVYSRVRHPMYLGVLLLYLGLASSTLSMISLGLWLGIFAAYDGMAAYEEQDLIRIFDEDYADYKRRVPRWIPWSFNAEPKENKTQGPEEGHERDRTWRELDE